MDAPCSHQLSRVRFGQAALALHTDAAAAAAAAARATGVVAPFTSRLEAAVLTGETAIRRRRLGERNGVHLPDGLGVVLTQG